MEIKGYRITADNDTIMRQGPTTIELYINEIKGNMGEEWCEKNPMAMAMLVQACATECSGGFIARAMEGVAEAIEELSSTMRELDQGSGEQGQDQD
jgi:hypothetical protein